MVTLAAPVILLAAAVALPVALMGSGSQLLRSLRQVWHIPPRQAMHSVIAGRVSPRVAMPARPPTLRPD